MVVGFVLRGWSVYSLWPTFSFKLSMPQQIIRKGPYKWVRHPSYLGTLLMLAGISLMSCVLALNWLGFMFFLARSHHEEQVLSQHPEWPRYHYETGRFIPKWKKGR